MSTNDDWQAAREAVGDIERVLELMRGPRPRSRTALGLSYPAVRGDRRGKTKLTGERVIENDLIGRTIELVGQASRPLARIEVVGNALPLGAARSSQREIDLWGVDAEGAPVAIEVKDTDADPWYALVELGEYVWRMRHDAKGLESALRRALADERRHRGTWGLLIGPARWWEKSRRHPSRGAHEELISALAENTELRVCSGVYRPGDPQVAWVAGRPPR